MSHSSTKPWAYDNKALRAPQKKAIAHMKKAVGEKRMLLGLVLRRVRMDAGAALSCLSPESAAKACGSDDACGLYLDEWKRLVRALERGERP
jgi:hypothetical protein